MSRSKNAIVAIVAGFGLSLPLAMIGAPAATAAEPGQSCSFSGKWGGKTYTSGTIVFKKWFYNSGVCWTVHDVSGRLSNWTISTQRPQSGTTYTNAYNGFYTVGDIHGLDQIIDIEVWKGGSWIKVRLNS